MGSVDSTTNPTANRRRPSEVFRPLTLMQVALLSVAMLIVMASLVSGAIASRLDDNIRLLDLHNTADQVGALVSTSEPYAIENLQNNLVDLRWFTYSVLGASLAAQCLGLFAIIWFAARITRNRKYDLEQRNRELASLNQLFKHYSKEDGPEANQAAGSVENPLIDDESSQPERLGSLGASATYRA